MTTPTVVSEREWVTYPLGEDRPCVSYAFRIDPEFVAPCRSVAHRHIKEWGLSRDLAEITELIVSELVTNVIRHVPFACPIGSVTLWHNEEDRRLVTSVHDRSKYGPWVRTAAMFDPPFGDRSIENGRGLFLVSTMTRTLGGSGVYKRADWDGKGKTVQAWLPTG